MAQGSWTTFEILDYFMSISETFINESPDFQSDNSNIEMVKEHCR